MNTDIRKIIRTIKKTEGINQSEIAERIGMPPTYLSDIVNGRKNLSDDYKEKIKDTFPYCAGDIIFNQSNNSDKIINQVQNTSAVVNLSSPNDCDSTTLNFLIEHFQEEIKHLKEEIKYLREQNSQLINNSLSKK